MFCFAPQITEIKKGKRTVKGMISEVISELGNKHPQTGTAPSGVSRPTKLPDPAHAHGPLFSV